MNQLEGNAGGAQQQSQLSIVRAKKSCIVIATFCQRREKLKKKNYDAQLVATPLTLVTIMSLLCRIYFSLPTSANVKSMHRRVALPHGFWSNAWLLC